MEALDAWEAALDARAALRLDDGVGNVSPSYGHWHPKARDFYRRVTPLEPLQASLAEFNVTVDELQVGGRGGGSPQTPA